MKKILLCFSLVFMLSTVWAQERVISGKVTSAEDGSALPGVNVVLKGTVNGTVTDTEGNYKLNAPTSGGILVFSFIGLQTQESEIGTQSTVDMALTQDVKQLTEVVVTALGIQRTVKSITYAQQSVSSDKLNMTRANNVNDALAGKIAGVQVRGASGAALGRNSDIRIRGASSLVDGNPLYILDGTPVSSQDINPDDIETTDVLKGPSATALYGQRGSYGVIIMTSKRAKKGDGLGINFSNTTYAEKVYILPREQNSYAGGAAADLQKFTWQNGMPSEWQSLDGKYYPDYTDDGSWGPRMVGQEYIPWYAWAPGTKYTGKTASLTPQPNNIRDFYKTGINRITNLSLAKAEENYSIRVSYTNQGQTGIMPNTRLDKNTFSTQTSVNLSKLLTVGANINYVATDTHGQFDDNYSNQTTGSFNQWFHRDLDMNILNELSGLKSPGGRYVSWNHFNPTSYLAQGDGFYRGYYWYGHKTYMDNIDYNDHRKRLFGDLNLTLNLTKNLKLQAFYQRNETTGNYENKRPSILPYSFQTELRPTGQDQWDYYATGQSYQKEDNLQFLASFNKTFFENKLSIDANVGGNDRREKYSQISANTVNGLVVPDLFTLANSKASPFSYSNNRSEKEVRSLYARATVGYKDLLFVDLSARNDWSSALPANKNSYFYPSAGATFVFSELTESVLPALSLGKLRASVAQVGSDLAPYQLGLLYSIGGTQWNGNSTSGTPDVLVDPNIKPSLSTSWEVGADLKFFQNRLGLSATYYDQVRTNEILNVGVSNASGFGQKLINAGKLENKGIELQLDATPVSTGDFSWNISYNMAHNISKVISLAPGIDAVAGGGSFTDSNGAPVFSPASSKADAFGNVTVYNIAGQQWGQLRGFGIQKIDGQPVLNDVGLYTPIQNQNLGSILPKFTGGLQNVVSYKDFSLSFNIDFQSGGKFFSLSDWFGNFSGLTERTAQLNDKGVPERTAVGDGGGVHVTGVDANGEKKDYYVDGKTYYQQFVNNGIAENSIFDLTYIKLREVGLSYRIPVKKIGVGKVLKTASITVNGRNLWMIYAKSKDFDPSIIATSYGENGQLPGTRGLGFQLKLGF